MDNTKELLEMLNQLEKKSNLDLAMRVMELTADVMALEKDWETLRKRVEQFKQDKFYDNDVFRYTAYAHVLEEMDKIKENN